MAKLFRVVDFEITAITHYDSLNLKKYCKKIFVVKDYSLKTLEKIFLETDPYQKKSFLLFSLCNLWSFKKIAIPKNFCEIK